MAVTEVTKKSKAIAGTLSRRYSDEQTSQVFNVYLDAQSEDLPTILAQAQQAGFTARIPNRGEAWPVNPTYGLYADSFAFSPVEDLLKWYEVTVNYMPLKPGEPNTEETNDNPLLWPRTYKWDWVEFEEAIVEARNVDAFTGGAGRAALTLGPMENPAYQEYDEGLFETVREGVLCIRYNVATLEEISDIEDEYSGTCNSDTVAGRPARRWKYIGVEDGEEQIANGVKYRPIVVRVQLTRSTDRKVNSVGWKHYNPAGTDLVIAKVKDDDTGEMVPASEPVFIGLDGKMSASAVSNSWRYKNEVPYAPLING